MEFLKKGKKAGRFVSWLSLALLLMFVSKTAACTTWLIHPVIGAASHKHREPTIEELETRIEKLRKSIARFEHQIRFYEFKISLHNECRSCHANCRPQGTGACRHFWRGEFDGKMYRASHQLPKHEKKRYDGINRAVSALQLRINGCRKNIAKLEARIEALEEKISEKEEAGED